MKKTVLIFALGLLLPSLWFSACQSDAYKTRSENPELLHRGFRRILEIMRHQIFSPPVASRVYAYSAVAAYEALIPGHPEYKSLAGQLNGLEPCPKPEAGKDYCFPLASVNAMLKVAKNLLFSDSDVEELRESVFKEFQDMDVPADVYERSMVFGDSIAEHIMRWSKGDNYAQLRSAPKFTIDTKIPGRWVPTPPQYSDALEPHWSEMRPWVLDSSAQFKSISHFPYSEDKNSDFYKSVVEVYEKGKNLTDAEKETALYWDDNPFEVTVSGHLMVATKKINPGSHWINITGQVCRKAKASLMKSAETYTLVALALADGFISCWAAKYASVQVRPETVINRSIDADWHPFIETPPFPEHTSGHSTVSAAAATMLTHQFGEPFEFIDSTEMDFGMKARTFQSFYHAADEAAVSRFYGGIHYQRGNEGGRLNGREVANYIWNTIKLK